MATNVQAGEASPALTDEQRSALKQNNDPVRASALRLSDADMQWWREARVGMFIHWGVYAVPGEGEWVMHNKKIPAEEYAKLADQFTAAKFDASEWARIAKSGGMRYMVLTARHHDGFSLWDSPSSYKQFTSMHAASHRDIIAEYTDAVSKAGLKVGIYYSPMDWRFSGYFHPVEQPESAQAMKQQGYGQIRELMSKYGKIDVLWYDGGWLAHQGTDADAAWLWDPIKLNTMVRELQPKIVISPRSGWEGDFRCEEGGGEIKGPIRKYAWEKCFSILGAWGYTKSRHLMPLNELITHVVNAAVRDGNTLINVGPDPEGVISADQVQRVAELGQWLSHYGQSIYGTRGGPFEPLDGVYGTTYRDNRIYVHVLKWPGETLELPALPGRLLSSRVLTGGSARVDASGTGTAITRKASGDAPVDTIVELELDQPVPALH
jgi:alpha-L-fucosidase